MHASLHREPAPAWIPPRIEARPLPNPQANHLLAELEPAELQRWGPGLEHVELPLGQVLCEPGRTMTHLYFPTTAIVSLLCVMEDGDCAETAAIGNEGMVGVELVMGGNSMRSRAVVQSAGHGYRLRAQVVKDEFSRGGAATHLLLRYLQMLITQISQLAACNHHHSLDQRLCHWLLRRLDRLEGNEMVMTHELIASMLGVRRGGVTESALKLQEAGLIRYARGHIAVLDRAGLEKRTCECYAVVRSEQRRLLPQCLFAQ